MATLYHYMDCPYCFRVRLYAAERDLPFESVVVERGAPPPELPSLNPLRRLPVWITDENRPIFGDLLESGRDLTHRDGERPRDRRDFDLEWLANIEK